MISKIRYFMGSILLGIVILLSTKSTAQSDFLFIIDNSGSISNAEFDQFVNIITATGNTLDADCPNSNFAVVHYGGAFGMETFIHNDFIPFAMTNIITRQYLPCAGPTGPFAMNGECGDDLPNAFADITSYLGNGSLNLTPGNDLIVVVFTDADGQSLGMNNVSPCSFAACSTLLPYTQFNDFIGSLPMVSSYVVGVEDTDNEGLLSGYISGDGTYIPIAFSDDPTVAAELISDEIDCMTTMYTDCEPFTVEFTGAPPNGMFCYYLLTDLNGSILAINGTEATFAPPPLGSYFSYIWCTDDPFAIPMIGQDVTMIPTNGVFDLSFPILLTITECPVIGIAKDLIDVSDNGDGTYEVSYAFVIENYTGLTFTDAEILDNIVTPFASLSPTNYMVFGGTLTGNNGWNGTPGSNVLAAGQSIGPNALESINVSFDITPDYFTTNVDNSAFLNVTDPTDDVINDTSTDGDNPDPGGDDIPDEDDPTPTPIPNPPGEIGLAKDLIDVSDNGDGTYEVSYLFTIENFSDFPLVNITLTDDILTPFAGLNPQNFATINGSFNGFPLWNGSGASNILIPGQTLAVDAVETISVSFDITPDGITTNVDNTATVSGSEPDGDVVMDVSHDGLEPDPNDNDIPDEDDPTPTPIPTPDGLIGLSKDLIAVTDNGNGTFEVSFFFTVENFSPFPLVDIAIYDDIINQFTGLFPENYATIDGSFNGSGTWDGSSTSNILAPGQSLGVGASETVSVSFDVTPDGITTQVLNVSTAEGTDPDGDRVTDTATDGIDPDPSMNNIPDEDEPTPVPLPLFESEINGTVFLDDNYNGVQENGDNGYGGLLVQLLDCNGQVVATTNTNFNGDYTFDDVTEGQYQIQFSTPNNSYFYTLQNQGINDTDDSDANEDGLISCFFVPGGLVFENFDAGIVQYSSIGNYVFNDSNGDGVNNFDPGIANVLVVLHDAATGDTVAVNNTNGGGFYMFNQVVPGDYYVSFDAPGDYSSTTAFSGFDISRDSDVDGSNGPGTTPTFNITSGVSNQNIDAGYYMCTLIGEFTWYDIVENDRKEAHENGINGLLVELYRRVNGVWTVFDATYTGHKPGTPSDDGYFKFCAPPGTYYIQVNIPQIGLVAVRKDAYGYTPLANPGEQNFDSDINSSGRTDQFNVVSGQEICRIGAGFYPMARIGNRVWNDLNADGIQTIDEPSMENVVVEAYNIYGEMVGESITDAQGTYDIDYLGKEDYYLRFTPNNGYAPTTANMGLDDTMDSDIDHSNGPNTTAFYSTAPGDVLTHVDAGLFLGVVPMDWLSVEALEKEDHNLIQWETTNERNVSHYEIEKRVNGTFEKIATVAAFNVSSASLSYEAIDENVSQNGDFHYRIKGLDEDGSYHYSKTVSIRKYDEGREISIFPNPARSEVFVNISSGEKNVEVKLYNTAGQLIKTIKSEDSSLLSIDLEGLTKGIYQLHTIVGNTTDIQKIIKI